LGGQKAIPGISRMFSEFAAAFGKEILPFKLDLRKVFATGDGEQGSEDVAEFTYEFE